MGKNSREVDAFLMEGDERWETFVVAQGSLKGLDIYRAASLEEVLQGRIKPKIFIVKRVCPPLAEYINSFEISKAPSLCLIMDKKDLKRRLKHIHNGVGLFLERPLDIEKTLKLIQMELSVKRINNFKILMLSKGCQFCRSAMQGLAKSQMHCHVFCTPEELWKELTDFRPHVLVLQMRLDLLKAIRQNSLFRDLPVVYLCEQNARLEEAYEWGVDEIFFLPIIPRVFLARMTSIAQKIALRSILRDQDPLTTLMNRRSFYEKATKLLMRAEKEQMPISFVLIDLDHFKEVNDLYGHNAGDEVLQRFSQFLKVNVRHVDLVARWGGEEFVIMFRACFVEEAKTLMARCLKCLEEELVLAEEPTYRLSFSCGITSFPKDGNTVEILSIKADEAMYQAKREGRNRTCVYDEALRI